MRELMVGVPWFRDLDTTQLDALLSDARVQIIEHHGWLFRQDEDAKWLYVTISGGLRLVRTAEDGRLATIRCIEQGGPAGELSMMSDQPRYLCSAEALMRTEVLVLDLARCWRHINANSACRAQFMRQLSDELTERLEDMVLLTQGDAQSRLISFILRQLPTPVRLPGTVQLDISKRLLAAQLAMTPETLSRLLTRLRESGAISVERTRLIVHDDQKLRTMKTAKKQ
jgi:CRP-like cAMP-binding protein